MEVNLSYDTICELRECVEVALCAKVAGVERGTRIFTTPMSDIEERAKLFEHFNMLSEFIETMKR